MTTTPTKQAQKIIGKIVSHKTRQTAIVKVNTIKVHPKYHKRYLETKKFAVHDEKDEYKLGDMVVFVPCAPKSRTKRFIIISKVTG